MLKKIKTQILGGGGGEFGNFRGVGANLAFILKNTKLVIAMGCLYLILQCVHDTLNFSLYKPSNIFALKP